MSKCLEANLGAFYPSQTNNRITLVHIVKYLLFLYRCFCSLAILSGSTSQEKAMTGAMKSAGASGTWWIQII